MNANVPSLSKCQTAFATLDRSEGTQAGLPWYWVNAVTWDTRYVAGKSSETAGEDRGSVLVSLGSGEGTGESSPAEPVEDGVGAETDAVEGAAVGRAVAATGVRDVPPHAASTRQPTVTPTQGHFMTQRLHQDGARHHHHLA
ncbi:hypothetical protein GCM10023196_015950 [Actinoallomurus vinaceus]|uniref:Uncharacterized protein n=1 Tax=Actinoallomurus vinaceus TaxID=1080074 RepID=A0ABP8U662_9ACTN